MVLSHRDEMHKKRVTPPLLPLVPLSGGTVEANMEALLSLFTLFCTWN